MIIIIITIIIIIIIIIIITIMIITIIRIIMTVGGQSCFVLVIEKYVRARVRAGFGKGRGATR